MERSRVGIVIPALNEAPTIGAVVASVLPLGIPIVVDDGSGDQTSAVAATAGADVVRHESNQGYDQALNSGFARAEQLGCEAVLTMDADGQHDPSVATAFLRALDDGADVVVGVRDRRQRVTEHLFAWVARFKWGLRDPLCGMKAYRMDVYRSLGHCDCYNSIGTELVLHATTNRRRLAQIPVRIRRRVGTPRFGRCISANLRILCAIWLGVISNRRVVMREHIPNGGTDTAPRCGHRNEKKQCS